VKEINMHVSVVFAWALPIIVNQVTGTEQRYILLFNTICSLGAFFLKKQNILCIFRRLQYLPTMPMVLHWLMKVKETLFEMGLHLIATQENLDLKNSIDIQLIFIIGNYHITIWEIKLHLMVVI
jgi:hypothetical protein